MWRTAHQVTFAAPVRLTASMSCQARCQSSYDVSSIACGATTPALLTSTSIEPSAAAAAVDHRAHRVRVREVGARQHVALARQRRGTASAFSREAP